VAARLAWQRPKAALSGVCLVVLVLVGQQAWQALIARSRRRPGRWTFRERGLLVAGIGAVPGALLAAVMAVANTQASLAPLTLTLLYG